jgi:hypothetical protein
MICQGRSESLAGVAGVADGLRAVVGAMLTFPAFVELQTGCCGALRIMFNAADALCDAAVDAGAVPALVAALRAHVQCEDVDVIAGALGRLILDRPTATAQAGAAGAVTATVALLRAHPASAAVQVAGCSVLGSLASDAESQKNALEGGATEVILLALRAHAADALVQTYGCRALEAIVRGHAAAFDARSCSVHSDAVKAVVNALNAHRDNEGVQLHACGALWRLAGTEAQKVEAAKLGAVTAAVAALRAHPASAPTQRAACRALGCLCLNNAANAVEACGAGALQAIVAALRAYPANVHVQAAGGSALDCIVDANPRLQAAAGAAGAVEAIAAAPIVGADLARLSYSALFTIISGHHGNLQRARATGVIEAQAAAMRTSWAHEDTDRELSVYDCALRVLDPLLEGDEDAARRAIHAGVLDILSGEPVQRSDLGVHAAHARLLTLLNAAAQRHDATACTHDGCRRCAAARECGCMCALPGCGARKRADGSGKGLLRCGACRRAAVCGPAHQREDWERHKTECAALRAAAEEEDGAQGDE